MTIPWPNWGSSACPQKFDNRINAVLCFLCLFVNRWSIIFARGRVTRFKNCILYRDWKLQLLPFLAFIFFSLNFWQTLQAVGLGVAPCIRPCAKAERRCGDKSAKHPLCSKAMFLTGLKKTSLCGFFLQQTAKIILFTTHSRCQRCHPW